MGALFCEVSIASTYYRDLDETLALVSILFCFRTCLLEVVVTMPYSICLPFCFWWSITWRLFVCPWLLADWYCFWDIYLVGVFFDYYLIELVFVTNVFVLLVPFEYLLEFIRLFYLLKFRVVSTSSFQASGIKLMSRLLWAWWLYIISSSVIWF